MFNQLQMKIDALYIWKKSQNTVYKKIDTN